MSEAKETLNPSEGELDKGKKGMPRSRVILFLVILLTITCVLIVVCLFIAFIFASVFSLSGHFANDIYYLAVGTGLFTIFTQILGHVYHRWPIFPIYLLSSIGIGVILYGFISSLIAGHFLLVVVILNIDYHPDSFTIPLKLFLVGGTLIPIVYGLVDARLLRVTEQNIPLNRLKGRSVTIGFISDLHLGLLVGKRRMKKILSVLTNVKPDLIVIGGDLYDTKPKNIAHLDKLISSIPRIAPTYAVTGNHEFINGVDECVAAMEGLGIMVLRNKMVVDKGTGLQLLGVDDSSGQSAFAPEEYELSDIAADLDLKRPSVFLNHAPLDFKKATSLGIGLELSGHTHGGQLWPIGYVTKLIYKDGDRGLHRRGNSYLYISKGGGTWGPPLRVGASPEMSIMKLIPWKKGKKNK